MPLGHLCNKVFSQFFFQFSCQIFDKRNFFNTVVRRFSQCIFRCWFHCSILRTIWLQSTKNLFYALGTFAKEHNLIILKYFTSSADIDQLSISNKKYILYGFEYLVHLYTIKMNKIQPAINFGILHKQC